MWAGLTPDSKGDPTSERELRLGQCKLETRPGGTPGPAVPCMLKKTLKGGFAPPALSTLSQFELLSTVRHRGIETGISETSKRVSIFSFATQGGKQVSFYFRQGNWVQARDAQIRFPAG